MNTKNNKRRRESVSAIEKAFIELLQERDIKDVTVSDICKMTGLNRSTFYANFLDIYDLADKLGEKLEREFSEVFRDEEDRETDGALKMFRHCWHPPTYGAENSSPRWIRKPSVWWKLP